MAQYAAILSVFSFLVSLLSLWYTARRTKVASSAARRQASEIVFGEWASEEMRETRRYFFGTFVPTHRPHLQEVSLSEVSDAVADDNGRVRRLCNYFDRLGWLAAAELIDADYVMGPMQHSMRHVWLVVKDMVDTERERITCDKIPDPVFMAGFEWLYLWSDQKRNAHAMLARRLFVRPKLYTIKESRALQRRLLQAEQIFEQEFRDMLTKDETCGNSPHEDVSLQSLEGDRNVR